jgi:predicted RNase H-like HicB family nuclease
MDEALANLAEAAELYLEEADDPAGTSPRRRW